MRSLRHTGFASTVCAEQKVRDPLCPSLTPGPVLPTDVISKASACGTKVANFFLLSARMGGICATDLTTTIRYASSKS